jgi:hypothetical protein
MIDDGKKQSHDVYIGEALVNLAELLRYATEVNYMSDDEARQQAIYGIRALTYVLGDRADLF